MYNTYYVEDKHMQEWEQICKAYAKMVGAELLFVNSTSCGLAYKDGRLEHLYIDEMVDVLNKINTL